MTNQFQTTEPTDAPIDGIQGSVLLSPPIGTGCMACCSGGVDPSWGGVASVSNVTL